MSKTLLKHWPVVLALIVGLFMRSYQALDRFNYSHDSDLASWVVKDIIIDKHHRLIGQLTSSPGVFIGSLFYYLQVPFYIVGNMDPQYVVWLPIIIGLLSILSVYYVFNAIFGRNPAAFGSLLYAASAGLSASEREVVPTTPVFMWSIWLLYACFLLFNKDKKGLIIIAILWGLIWHINLALVVSVPLVLVVLLWKRPKFTLKDLVMPLVLVVGLSLPLIAFEVKHNFSQTQAIVGSVGNSTHEISLISKAEKVVLYLSKNVNNLFWEKPEIISYYILPSLLSVGALYLYRKGSLSKEYLALILMWLVLYVIEFSLYPINLSEYYLNGVTIVWVVIAALMLAQHKKIGLVVLALFMVHNITAMLNYNGDNSGYYQKKAIAEFITQDAASHGYPCVSVSYMTDPGRNLGYRYWFYLNKLHVNQPSSLSPVYTIVFPHQRANKLDKTFGALGLVLPDYDRYTSADIAKSCAGDNANLTDPMFGFTK